MLSGLPWLAQPGIQNDEALFASPLFHPVWAAYWVEMPHCRVPGFLLSYLGAIKSWVYAPVFWLTAPQPATIRVPALLAAAGAIWLFFCFLRRLSTSRAALFGAALLATDSLYLWTARCDWGPVALQHLFLAAGLSLAVRFHQTRSLPSLAGASLAFGLGLWDKALAIWMLGGLSFAALILCPRPLLRALSLRNAAVAVLCFCLGALPLLIYNLDSRQQPLFSTFRGNAKFEPNMILPKLPFLGESLKGNVLFGYVTRLDAEGYQKNSLSAAEEAVLWINRLSGRPRASLLLYAFLAALAGLPVLCYLRDPACRPALFALLACAIAWIQMAATRNAGAGAHHTVLLWPLPHMLVALVFAALSARAGRFLRRAVDGAIAAVCLSGVLLTASYYADLIRNGSAIAWTDAIYPLTACLKAQPAAPVNILDWGMFDSLRLLSAGSLDLRVGGDAFTRWPLPPENRDIARRLASPGSLFVAHSEGSSFSPEIPRNLSAWAQAEGLRKNLLRVVADSHGRPVFEVFRLEPALPAERR